jgi:hypothetical protein
LNTPGLDRAGPLCLEENRLRFVDGIVRHARDGEAEQPRLEARADLEERLHLGA